MDIKEVSGFLSEITLGDKENLGSLRHLAFVIGENEYNMTKNALKGQVVAQLSEYYCAPDRFASLWNSLSDAERKIISLHIWSTGYEPAYFADQVAEEFGVAKKKDNPYYSYMWNGLNRFRGLYAKQRTALWLLFPRSGGNRLFYDELHGAVGEMKREYAKVTDKVSFSTREHRVTDFASIVRFSNTNKMTATKNGLLSKPSALKLRAFCGYEEFASELCLKPEDIRTVQGLLVTHPLVVLCYFSGLLAITEGKFQPGGQAISLLNQPYERLVKKLFHIYTNSRDFDEISMISEKLRTKRGYHPFEARQNLVEELKHCPIGTPVYTRAFEQHLFISNKQFARKEDRLVAYDWDTYNRHDVGWESYEHLLIHIILTFYGALGLIDIAWRDDAADRSDTGKRTPIAFRINPLGAYVLGLSNLYAAPEAPKTRTKGGVTVLPDYTIVVPESSDRLKHELSFENLFTKVSATEQAAIYKLDFKTVVRALDSGTSVNALCKILSASDKPIPKNVARALSDWEKQVGRIKLRQVTILE